PSAFFLYDVPPSLRSTLFPYTTLFRSRKVLGIGLSRKECFSGGIHVQIPYGVVRSPAEYGAVQQAAARGIQFQNEHVRVESVRRSEEHTSELQSPDHLVCRLLLEKKKT